MPTTSLCAEHQQPGQGNCAACQKSLCNACTIRLSQGRTLCASCFNSQASGAGEASLAAYRKTWTQFKWFQILGVPATIAFVYFLNKANSLSCAFRIDAYLYFLIPLPIVTYLYFFFKLRCPSCRSYVLLYFGNSILESVRSKFCPRCGQQLKA